MKTDLRKHIRSLLFLDHLSIICACMCAWALWNMNVQLCIAYTGHITQINIITCFIWSPNIAYFSRWTVIRGEWRAAVSANPRFTMVSCNRFTVSTSPRMAAALRTRKNDATVLSEIGTSFSFISVRMLIASTMKQHKRPLGNFM